MARRVYTDADKAAVFAELHQTSGNVARTARACGFPEQTVRDWKKEWQAKGGPPAEIEDKAVQIAGEFAEVAEQVRDKALAKINELLEGPLDGKDIQKLATIVGILDDKVARAKGLATSRQEVVHTHQLSPDEIRSQMAEFVTSAVAAARDRDAVILDAEVVEQGDSAPLLSLNP